MPSKEHRDLVQDLARHLFNDRRMVWTDTPLGPVWNNREPSIADVLTLEKSWTKPLVRIYDGTHFFAQSVPRELREIAQLLERELEEEERSGSG